MSRQRCEHPLRRWMRDHPDFQPTRDIRQTFGVWHSFFYRVLNGHARPSPERARQWSRVTGIALEALLFPPCHQHPITRRRTHR